MSWQSELKNSIRNEDELAAALGLSEEERIQCAEVIAHYPMKITPYYISLVDKENPKDPIARMCVPSVEELALGGSQDTSGEALNYKAEGLQHKYRRTALLLSTNKCAMYCRHCFRRRMVGQSEDELNKNLVDAAAYISTHAEINNVLISGGDALMNTNAAIERYLNTLTEIKSLDLIRFGSRVPVTLPERIYGDEELLALLRRYSARKSLCLVTQFNHPREITAQAQRAVQALQECGVQVKNQTVLLKGVNDDAQTLGALLAGLTRIGVSPYYIFQCRPVTGVQGHFQVPLLEGVEIVDGAKALQNGFGKALRYVMSHPRGKIEIIGRMPDGNMLFKFHQNKYPEDCCRIFTRPISLGDTWLDEELNPVGAPIESA